MHNRPAPKFYIGTDAWGREEWKGILYPATSNKAIFDQYSDSFNFIELRSTFYKVDPAQIKTWLETVAEKDFTFCAWVPRNIIETKGTLAHTISRIEEFLSYWNSSPGKLAAAMITVAFPYSESKMQDLAVLIKNLPGSGKYILNLVHESWQESVIIERLREKADAASVPVILKDKSVPPPPNSPFTYLKFDLHNTSDRDGLLSLLPKDAEEIYICMTGTDKIKLLGELKNLTRQFRST